MLSLRQAQLQSKVEDACFDVAMNLSIQASSAPTLKMPRTQKLSPLSDEFGFGLGRPTISQNHSFFEINELLQKKFEEKGLKDVKFEFAITSQSNLYNIEMQSKDFIKEAEDTSRNRTIQAAINPQSGSQMEGLVPFEHLIVIVPDFKTQVWESLQWVVIGAIVFSIIIIAAFSLTVFTLFRQKKLSEIKTDFINNMTHEFKTPLATISLAVDALKNEKVVQDAEKRNYFNNIIKEENKRMNKHVETILQAALLDKQEIKLNLKPLHVHDLIQSTVNNFQLQLQDKHAQIQLFLNAKYDLIEADEVHFANVLNNLGG